MIISIHCAMLSLHNSDAMSKMNELATKSNTLTKDLAVSRGMTMMMLMMMTMIIIFFTYLPPLSHDDRAHSWVAQLWTVKSRSHSQAHKYQSKSKSVKKLFLKEQLKFQLPWLKQWRKDMLRVYNYNRPSSRKYIRRLTIHLGAWFDRVFVPFKKIIINRAFYDELGLGDAMKQMQGRMGGQ